MPTNPGENDLCFQGQTQTDRTKLAGVESERREDKGRKRHIKTQAEKHTQVPVLFILMKMCM